MGPNKEVAVAIYVAIVESSGAGQVKPLWTTRDPEVLHIIKEQFEKRLQPQEGANPKTSERRRESVKNG